MSVLFIENLKLGWVVFLHTRVLYAKKFETNKVGKNLDMKRKQNEPLECLHIVVCVFDSEVRE